MLYSETENTKTFQIADFDAQKLYRWQFAEIRQITACRSLFHPPPRPPQVLHRETSRVYIKCTGNFQRFWKLLRVSAFKKKASWNIPEYLKTLQRVQKHCIHIWNLSRVSRNFPKCPETFHTIWKLSSVSENLQEVPETFHCVPNFPKCPETFQSVQKRSLV